MPLTDEECPYCDTVVHTDGLIEGKHVMGCGKEFPDEMCCSDLTMWYEGP